MGRQTTTRERLVQTAAELFWAQGYAQTGVSAIMQRARATSGSFYHFFPTKEDLLLAVLDHVGEILENDVYGPAASATDDPVERVFEVFAFYRRHLEQHGFALGSPMANLVGELGDGHPEARDRVSSLFASSAATIEGWLTEAGGRLPGGSQGEGLAEFVLSALEGAVIQARARRSLEPFDRSVEQLKAHFDLLERRVNGGRDALVVRPTAAAFTGNADWRAW